MVDDPVLDVGAGIFEAVSLAAVAASNADGFAFVMAAGIGFLGEFAHLCSLKEEEEEDDRPRWVCWGCWEDFRFFREIGEEKRTWWFELNR